MKQRLLQRGQATLLVIMIIGTILAAIVFYGSQRQSDLSEGVAQLETAQQANEALSSVAKKVQAIYMQQAACDPDILNTRLSAIRDLPNTALASTYVVADASNTAGSSRAKYNLCDSAADRGCRQFSVPVEGNKSMIVTVGKVVAVANSSGANTCSRDATVSLATAIRGINFFRKVTLVNLCTLTSCGTGAPSYDFNVTNTNSYSAEFPATTACGNIPTARIGSIVTASFDRVTPDDLRWVKKYLETGGGAVGETVFMATTGTLSGNGTCSPASSVNQCVTNNCVPAIDFNGDKANNEQDLAILEFFLRGLLGPLKVRAF